MDLPTLLLTGGLVSLFCALLLLMSAWRSSDAKTLVWWSLGCLALSGWAVASHVGAQWKLNWAFDASMLLATLAPALFLISARSFNRRATRTAMILVSAFVWMQAHLALHHSGDVDEVSWAHVLGATSYYVLTFLEIARGPSLGAKLPLLALVGLHTVLMVGMAALAAEILRALPLLHGITYAELNLFVIGSSLFLVTMVKERSEERQRRAATTDALTGLPNRRAVFDLAEPTISRLRAEETPFAVAVFDLDRFKAVNDTFGHAVGDRALMLFADTMRAALRPVEVVGRLGGEEFVAILAGVGTRHGVQIADRLRAAFAGDAGSIDGHPVGATVSIGLAFSDGGTCSFESLLAIADEALYAAKLNGRDRVEWSEADCGGRPFPRLVVPAAGDAGPQPARSRG